MASYLKTSIRRYRDIIPVIGAGAYIDPTATVIGSVYLGADVSVWPMVTIRGDVNTIHIGSRTNIQDGSVIHVSRRTNGNPNGHPTVIGDNVTIGHKVMLHGCTIGNRVLVGMGTIILDGAVVDDEVIVGAGSLVTPGKRLQRGYLYMGSPARQVRALQQKEHEQFDTTANKYIELKNEYIDEMGKLSL